MFVVSGFFVCDHCVIMNYCVSCLGCEITTKNISSNQVALLKKVKAIAVQNEETLKETVEKTQNELTAVSTRLKVSKQHAQVTYLYQSCP